MTVTQLAKEVEAARDKLTEAQEEAWKAQKEVARMRAEFESAKDRLLIALEVRNRATSLSSAQTSVLSILSSSEGGPVKTADVVDSMLALGWTAKPQHRYSTVTNMLRALERKGLVARVGAGAWRSTGEHIQQEGGDE